MKGGVECECVGRRRGVERIGIRGKGLGLRVTGI